MTSPIRHRAAAIAAAVALAAASLGGCSESDAGDAGSASPGKNKDATPTQVVILTHGSFDLPEELVARFEENTGYTLVTQAAPDGGTVLGQLVLAKDAPNADGVFGLDAYSVMHAVDKGLLAEYASPALPDSAARHDIDSHVTPTDIGAVCVNADNAWFDANGRDIPQSLDELAKPDNAKLLVVENPVESDTGMGLLVGLAATRGQEGMLDYYETLLDGGAKVASSWSDAYYTDFSGADGHGPYPLVLSYSTSPAESEGATSIVADTCVQAAEYAGVVKGAKNPAGAQAFIDFLLSREVQEAFPQAMYMYPVDAEAALPEAWAQRAQLPEAALEFDAREVAANREGWLKAWTEMYEAR